jgi:tetratricopeptide (TPR) repeat protein
MKSSSMIWKEEYEKTSANGHRYFGKPEDFRKESRAHSAASLYTTAEDYARFVCAVLNGEGIKNETLKNMLTPQIDVDKKKGLTWSLGFGMQEDENGTAFWQWGDYGIFRNYIIAYPQHKVAVVYLTNSYNGLSICPDLVSRSIGGQALGNAFLGYKHYDYPVHEFNWLVKEQGPQAVQKLLPKMKAKYPDVFSNKTIERLGSFFINEKLFDEAIALYELNVKENPESAPAISRLARTYLEKGDRNKARLYYHKVLEVNKDEKFDTKSIDWAMAYIQALEKPKKLSMDYLETLAGDYEERHVQFRNGSLYYFRENAANKDYVKLFAISTDTFIIEGLIYFRLRFEFDPQGRAAAIVGMFEGGGQDRLKRDK